ncbi:MAG: acyl-CoA/acyl-ACP dehydrogenase [Dehalococcoidia bacterium]|nr:acyl-CoA/acyl-ACP dehydrogenase [Dehalococcoidia bacterium]
MDFDLNEEQEMLQKMSRDFLINRCPGPEVRKLMDEGENPPPELWKEMADLGWMGLAFPPQYGGEGGSFLDLVVLLQEMGRAGLPGPFFSTVTSGLAVLHMGTEEQKKQILPSLCTGELLLTSAIVEEEVKYDASGIDVKATQEKDQFVLSGVKKFVPEADTANYIICFARTSKAQGEQDGVTLFLIDRTTPGVEVTVLKPLDGSRQCNVRFNNVKVSASAVLGQVDKGWHGFQKVLEMCTIAKCAEMLGGAEAILAMSSQYSKERVQFGKPIGSYQAIQHRGADMAIDVDAMRLTTYDAAWMLSEGIPCAKEVAIAKGWASDAFRRVVFGGMRIHGGNGFMLEHDVTIHYRKALASEYYFGDARHHRKVILEQIGA